MSTVSFDKAMKIWKRIVISEDYSPLAFELQIHKQLLELFHVGPYYYYVFNCATGNFDYLDPKSSTILGYKLEEITPAFLYSKIHTEDIGYVLDYEDSITSFYEKLPLELRMSYKTSYDFRLKIKNGEYIRLLQQVTAMQVGEDGSVFRTLGIHTDISHLKPSGKPVLNFLSLNGAPHYSEHQLEEGEIVKLTKRELEIVKLIAEGDKTNTISEKLFLSKFTVQTHRKNIMKKTTAVSVADLVRIAIENGWV